MIILVTGSSRSEECAAAIERKTHQKTTIAASLAMAIECLQEQEVEALVIDDSFQQVESRIDSLVATYAGTALPIYVNLSLHGANRVAHEVSCGLQRLAHERLLGMRAAANELRNELRGEVTAILLNAGLALRERPLTPVASEKLRVVCEMAERMRQRLEEPAVDNGKTPLRPRLVVKTPDAALTQ